MLEYIREGDKVYIHDLSRLARSTKDLLTIIETLKNKKVELISNKENIDTSTPTGKLMITMIGAIYEFERDNLLERQKEGIHLAKKEGKYTGRKRIQYPENLKEVYSKWKIREITANKAMEQLGLKRNTFYSLVKEYELEQQGTGD